MTYYEVLGVSLDAEDVVITAAYKALMRRYHPDASGSPHTDGRAKAINEAYAVLCDPARRRAYDDKLAAKGSSGRSANSTGADGPASGAQAGRSQQEDRYPEDYHGQSFYEWLGLTSDANMSQIAAACYAKRLQFSELAPSRNMNKIARFVRDISAAENVLLNPDFRVEYDWELAGRPNWTVWQRKQKVREYEAQVKARKLDRPNAKIHRRAAKVANGAAVGFRVLKWGIWGVIGLGVVVGLLSHHGGSTSAASAADPAPVTSSVDAPASSATADTVTPVSTPQSSQAGSDAIAAAEPSAEKPLPQVPDWAVPGVAHTVAIDLKAGGVAELSSTSQRCYNDLGQAHDYDKALWCFMYYSLAYYLDVGFRSEVKNRTGSDPGPTSEWFSDENMGRKARSFGVEYMGTREAFAEWLSSTDVMDRLGKAYLRDAAVSSQGNGAAQPSNP